MIQRTIVQVVILAMASAWTQADEPPVGSSASRSPLAAKPLDQGSIDGVSVVRLRPSTISSGQVLTIECSFRCTGGAGDVWNGFLSEDALLPAQIVITSADGSFRQELLERRKPSRAGREPTRWLLLRSTDTIGRELRVLVNGTPDDPTSEHERSRSITLKSGEYFVQAIYNHWLIAPRQLGEGRDGPPRAWENWSPEQMAAPVAISEPVKLIVR
jgi:hypothetical protein